VLILMRQQPTLAFQAATKPGQRSIGPDNPVAGNDHRYRIGTIGGSHSTYGCRATDPGSQLAVAHSGSGRNISQRKPDLALKAGAPSLGADGLDRIEIALKVGLNRKSGTGGSASFLQLKSILTVMEPQQALHAICLILPVGRAHPLLRIGDNDHSPGRGIELL
jgi:hypothetical protein